MCVSVWLSQCFLVGVRYSSCHRVSSLDRSVIITANFMDGKMQQHMGTTNQVEYTAAGGPGGTLQSLGRKPKACKGRSYTPRFLFSHSGILAPEKLICTSERGKLSQADSRDGSVPYFSIHHFGAKRRMARTIFEIGPLLGEIASSICGEDVCNRTLRAGP